MEPEEVRREPDTLRDVELAVGRMLRSGVLVASALILAGLIVLTATPRADLGRSVAAAGLLALVLTPVSRVVAALWVFWRERDWVYALFSLTVLVALAAGVLVGKVE